MVIILDTESYKNSAIIFQNYKMHYQCFLYVLLNYGFNSDFYFCLGSLHLLISL